MRGVLDFRIQASKIPIIGKFRSVFSNHWKILMWVEEFEPRINANSREWVEHEDRKDGTDNHRGPSAACRPQPKASLQNRRRPRLSCVALAKQDRRMPRRSLAKAGTRTRYPISNHETDNRGDHSAAEPQPKRINYETR